MNPPARETRRRRRRRRSRRKKKRRRRSARRRLAYPHGRWMSFSFIILVLPNGVAMQNSEFSLSVSFVH